METTAETKEAFALNAPPPATPACCSALSTTPWSTPSG
jgi:hypothetical protein